MPPRNRLTHLDPTGRARMVDVSAKPPQRRTAIARGAIRLQPATIHLIRARRIAKGDVLNTARLAGIQAAKRTADLIPLCHPLPLTHVDVELELRRDRVLITGTATVTAPTGVEMEALTAVAVAALTIYDMCKAADKTMRIGEIRLLSKRKE